MYIQYMYTHVYSIYIYEHVDLIYRTRDASERQWRVLRPLICMYTHTYIDIDIDIDIDIVHVYSIHVYACIFHIHI